MLTLVLISINSALINEVNPDLLIQAMLKKKSKYGNWASQTAL